MTNNLQITIDGEGLDDSNEGELTVSLRINGRLSAETGLVGAPVHALPAAHDLAIENDLFKEGDHD